MERRHRTEDPESGGTRLRSLARRATPWGFPVLYLGWAYLFWAPVVASGESVWTFPNVALLAVGGLSPLLAGVLLLGLTQGRSGYADLCRRLTGVGRISPRWWVVLVAYWPAFTVALAGIALAVGLTSSPLEFIEVQRLVDPVALVSLVAFAFLIPLVEETGLRGYWFDRLQARYSALAASLVLGATWAAWHVPLTLMTGYYQETTFQPELWWWLPDVALTAVVATWVYNNTRRSVLAAICFHAFGNLRGEVMGFDAAIYPYVFLGTFAVAALLVAVEGAESLRGRDVPRPVRRLDD
ncbi:CPBP family intramembrane glutamic endopeptidase [Halomicrococcus gelatinilyticus]|uniref:CPBP family intramembrane glutamic endopeptidase n=1 Tax=Halomicrococcus gelatinilyticus TaxID=1702103 RepID=UPI002E128F4E